MTEHWKGGNGGKGSKPRPYSVGQDEYGDRFDAIFRKKDKKQEKNILNTTDNHTHNTVVKHTNTQEK